MSDSSHTHRALSDTGHSRHEAACGLIAAAPPPLTNAFAHLRSRAPQTLHNLFRGTMNEMEVHAQINQVCGGACARVRQAEGGFSCPA